jgi:hypothetical protein
MKLRLLGLALAVAACSAAAQPYKRPEGGFKPQPQQMREEERQRLREDMRDAYRSRAQRRERPREMSPEERDQLRRDIQDANRELRR